MVEAVRAAVSGDALISPSITVRLLQHLSAPAPATGGNKPNIIFIVSDDFGYGDAGCYLGGETRGMPTPNIDRLAGC